MTTPFLGAQPHEGRTAILAVKGVNGPAAAAILEAADVAICTPPAGYCAVASADALQTMVSALVKRLPALELNGQERQLELLIALLESYHQRPVLCSQLYFTCHCRNTCAVNVAGGPRWAERRAKERDHRIALYCEKMHFEVGMNEPTLRIVLETEEPTTLDTAVFSARTLCGIPGLAEQLIGFASAVAIIEEGIYSELQVIPGATVRGTAAALEIPRVVFGGEIRDWSTFIRCLNDVLDRETKARYGLS